MRVGHVGYVQIFACRLVMLSHFPGVYLMSNLGQSAVLAFYFISGWHMAMSYARFKAKGPSPNSAFFMDRAIKIWPSYALSWPLPATVAPVVQLAGCPDAAAGKVLEADGNWVIAASAQVRSRLNNGAAGNLIKTPLAGLIRTADWQGHTSILDRVNCRGRNAKSLAASE